MIILSRLVTRATIEERMMQQAKNKLVLEHLIVQEAGRSQQLRQQELDDLLRYGAEELFAEQKTELTGKHTPTKIFVCFGCP